MTKRKKITTGRRNPPPKTPRLRNRADLTLRNLQAAQKRLATIIADIADLQTRIAALEGVMKP